MKSLTKLAFLAIGASVLGASAASAEIACNREGECWHINGRADFYKPEHGIIIHPDGWNWGKDEHFKWREHEGRGFWKGGIWIKL